MDVATGAVAATETGAEPAVPRQLPAVGKREVRQEAAMMPYQSYQLFAAQRPKSAAEQRAADARRGELAAAIAGPVTAASGRICALIRWRARSSRRAAGLSSRTRVIEPDGITDLRYLVVRK